MEKIFLVRESFKRENYTGLEDYYSQFDEQLFQFYICVTADNAFTVETIFPYCGISMLYVDMKRKGNIGNNEYTRKLALKQMVELSLYFHAMSHFYEKYKQIYEMYLKRENVEIMRLHSQSFQNSKQQQGYKMNMNRRLNKYYFELYHKMFSDLISPPYIKRLIIPQYLLPQVIREYERIIGSGNTLPI